MARLGAIWAQSLDGVIGDGESMPWHLPEDLRHFKEVTMGHPIIMGRNTWQSLPKRPLPGRANHVLSSREPGEWSDGAYVSPDLPDLEADAWIIGGGQLYESTIDEGVSFTHLAPPTDLRGWEGGGGGAGDRKRAKEAGERRTMLRRG
ncbi:dihydrofolate reductase [Corynebacterium bouchesdurhonense]|uniref:dihydrofolate reductase n=1 Tax=Corynebacterium bouchesdurhonense TaxID=1720192 RepID=UPI00098EF107|nr:dihydrofolate reductase [Corynebacterium bouchesdurhonense]